MGAQLKDVQEDTGPGGGRRQGGLESRLVGWGLRQGCVCRQPRWAWVHVCVHAPVRGTSAPRFLGSLLSESKSQVWSGSVGQGDRVSCPGESGVMCTLHHPPVFPSSNSCPKSTLTAGLANSLSKSLTQDMLESSLGGVYWEGVGSPGVGFSWGLWSHFADRLLAGQAAP